MLVLAPTGKDAELARAVLGRAGIDSDRCDDLAGVCDALSAGAGALLIAEEALAPGIEHLVSWLARQPTWSDLPILVLAATGADSRAIVEAMEVLGNVSVLERPLRVAALVSVVRTALRARARQYEAREQLAELERRERELRDFFEHAPVGLHWAGPDGTILRANDTELRMLGYSREEYVGHSMAEFHVDAELAASLLRRLARGETLRAVEARLRRRDGAIRYVLIDANVLWDQGRFVHTRSFIRDVTDRKQVEQALRESQRIELARRVEFEALMHAAPAAIWVAHDPACKRITGNPAADRMLRMSRSRGSSEGGASAAERLLRHVEILRDGKPVPVDELPMQTAARTGRAAPNQELELRFTDGSSSWMYGNAVPLFDARGEVRGVVSTFVDISVRKRAEQALQEADRRKDEFLAMLAHELRNPLAPIRNSLHILQLTAGYHPAAMRVLGMMQRQVSHMVRMVDDLLEVSRITRGKIELVRERIDLATVVRSAVETSRPLVEAGRHDLTVDLPEEPLLLEGDPVRLAQVFANLLNNAAKYTDPGGHIRIAARREGDSVEVSVQDDGTGISPEVLPHVFELFTRFDRGRDGRQEGLGIGLTLVRSLVALHGGTVVAASDGPGLGSEFTVRLPLTTGSAPEPREEEGTPAFVLAPRRILVVDDNHDAADSLGVLLELLGADVHVVYSGEEALAAMPIYRPAVVLLDIGMPGIDGHDVARRIRARPDFGDVTLIALTGWGQEEDRRRSASAGFEYHLIKPVDLGALQTLLLSLEPDASSPGRG